LNRIKEELLPNMTAESPHYLMKANEVRSIAMVTELYLNASLLRKETRCGHYRVEYPQRDDKSLGWFLIEKNEGNINWSFRPVPLEKYKVQPYRYYGDLYISPNVSRKGQHPPEEI
jgi:succinate dehydrogenase/fumarate reductase flavoprotein subunit